MSIYLSGICRGDGKVYLRVIVGDTDKTVIASAESPDGSDVPCSIYKGLSKNSDDGMHVVVLPILSIPRIRIFITELDKDGNDLQSLHVNFGYFHAKWKSRFNYRFNKDLCSQIRDYDRIGKYSKFGMEFWDCISDVDENILRGILRVPVILDNDIRIRCTTDKLFPIDINPIFLNNAIVKSSVSDSQLIRELQFSIRIPNEVQDLIFELTDSNHSELNSFEVLEEHAYKELLSANSEIMRSAQNDKRYHDWFLIHKVDLGSLAKQHETFFSYRPLFSIVVPLFGMSEITCKEMIDSVCSQSYGRWELILVNPYPEDSNFARLIGDSGGRDSRVKVVHVESNMGISNSINAGIAAVTGDFVCLVEHDGVIESDLLFEYTKALNCNDCIDMIYCDEDSLNSDGKYIQPFFKPDFSIDLLRSFNYVSHLLAIRKALLDRLTPSSSDFDGDQNYNIMLQASEHVREIYHVPRVLYHKRIKDACMLSSTEDKLYASKARLLAVKNHLARLKIRAEVSDSESPLRHNVIYLPPVDSPLVSIIIPSKDHSDVLRVCIESIINKTIYNNYEIIIVENNSQEAKTFEYYSELEKEIRAPIRIETWPAEFNFSKIVNFGVTKASGDYLLLLNNDTEVITPTWIDRMLGICSRSDVGIVGVRLYYRDNTIQHAGVCVTGLAAGHLARNLPKGNWGYFSLSDSTQNLSAVTAACMMTKRGIYEEVGGFSEELAVAFNDVDYCLKVRERCLLVVYTPYVELFHYESLSRGFENNVEKRLRFHREVSFMNYKWTKYYIEGDPYINSNITKVEPFNCYYHLPT